MLVSTKGRYALRMMVYIAQSSTKYPIALSEISQDEEISVKYLEQITSSLVHAGLLESVRGQKGGYRLTKAPTKISVGDILRAVEGDTAPVGCVAKDSKPCPRKDICTTIDFWNGLDKTITNYINRYSLAKLSK